VCASECLFLARFLFGILKPAHTACLSVHTVAHMHAHMRVHTHTHMQTCMYAKYSHTHIRLCVPTDASAPGLAHLPLCLHTRQPTGFQRPRARAAGTVALPVRPMLAFGAALRVQHDCVTGMAGHTQPPGFVRAKCVSGMARTGY